jgi:hypothetical protein
MKMWRSTISLFLLAMSGCQSGKESASTQPTTTQWGPMQMTVTAQESGGGDPGDPHPRLSAMVHLDIYMIDLPAGTVSGNREFWKRLDEDAPGSATAQRLNRNGVRCGVAPRTEGLYFSQFFDKQPHPPARRSRVDGIATESIPLEMEKKFDQQDLFFFNAAGELEGRSYEAGENQLSLTFGPTPRDPNSVRMTLCPVVTSEKTRTEFTPLNQQYDLAYHDVDRIYDLGLTVDVPGDSFMVIAPSPDAARRSSLGGCFLTTTDKSQRMEQVIVIVPTFLRLDGKPMVVREQLVK